MKTIIITLISLCLTFTVRANSPKTLDTIYANEKMTTALFFPSDIRQGITGSDNFIFTYNREQQQNLGLLKATPGNVSNLLVITTEGKVYSFIIKYADKLKKLNYFLTITQSIGDEKGESERILKKIEQEGTSLSDNTHEELVHSIKEQGFLQKSSVALLKLPERKNKKKRKKGMSLAIKNKVYHKAYVYIQFEIKNNSGIDFDINYLKLFKVSGNKKRKASYQELIIKPVFMYNLPGKVRHGETAKFVYVLPKFTLDKNEKVLVKLKEQQGRVLALKFR
ncbi:MAG: DUF4138 domain-containing protein [Flavobacteriaceae bacterium]|nr:DUF4138 domain-containing protein [Flavobacteriaceae bacterium]